MSAKMKCQGARGKEQNKHALSFEPLRSTQKKQAPQREHARLKGSHVCVCVCIPGTRCYCYNLAYDLFMGCELQKQVGLIFPTQSRFLLQMVPHHYWGIACEHIKPRPPWKANNTTYQQMKRPVVAAFPGSPNRGSSSELLGSFLHCASGS